MLLCVCRVHINKQIINLLRQHENCDRIEEKTFSYCKIVIKLDLTL